jgi:hypothetical protein
MPGPQTATVVGPKGLEIHTDPHGRIKVQFPWDRYGRHDERSSCWIRVSQPWAGAGWGTVAIPRIGQEVIIDYLEGDPDRPVCTGRLYNSAQPLPYALPGAAHVMGFKSRSTPGGGGYCEMVIHDRKGQELINIHSQKDMVTTVQHTQATVVNGPHQTNTVTNGFHVTKVKKRVELESQTEFIKLKAATGIVLEVGASRIEMEANGKITIRGLHVDVIGTSRIDLNTNANTEVAQSPKASRPEASRPGQAMVGSNEWKAERQQAQALQQPIIAPDDLIGGPLKLGAKGVAAGAGAVMGAMKSVGAKESGVLLRGGANGLERAATRASVDDKLARYLLNAEHPVGASKARWFDSALGFNLGNADQLAKQVVFNKAAAVQTAVTEHGIKFNQIIPITGANGKVIDVTFGWIRNNDGIVRLTTAIPTKK